MSLWAILATSLAVAAAPPQVVPPPDTGSAAIPEDNALPANDPTDEIVEGQADHYSRMTVPVTIGGQGPFHFMIDTGAQATAVTRGLTEKLNLSPSGSAILVGMGSKKAVQIVELDGLEFAQRVLNDIYAPMLEAQHVGADGILGLDSLQDLRVMIDFRDHTIAVNDSEVLGGNRGYEIIVRARHKLGRLIITDAMIDGVRTAVVIDTGSQSSFGNMKLKRRLRARKKTEEISSTDVNGAVVTGNRHFAKSLRIQGLQLKNMPITFADSPAFAALNLSERPALILGMRDLRLFDRVAIDFATRRILFDLPKGSNTHRGMHQKFQATRL